MLLLSAAMVFSGCAHYKPTTTSAPVQDLLMDEPAQKLYIATLSNSRTSGGEPNGGGLSIYDLWSHKFSNKYKGSVISGNNLRGLSRDDSGASIYITYQDGGRFSIWNTTGNAPRHEALTIAPGEHLRIFSAMPSGGIVYLAATSIADGRENVTVGRFHPADERFDRIFKGENSRPDGAGFGATTAELINDSVYIGLGPYQEKSALLRVCIANGTPDRHDLDGEVRCIRPDPAGPGRVLVGTLNALHIYDAANRTVGRSSLPEGVLDMVPHGDRMYLLTNGVDRNALPVRSWVSIRDYDPANDTSTVLVHDISSWVPGPFTSLARSGAAGTLFIGGAGLAIYNLSTGNHTTKTYKDGLPYEGPGNYGPGFGLAGAVAAAAIIAALKGLRRRVRPSFPA